MATKKTKMKPITYSPPEDIEEFLNKKSSDSFKSQKIITCALQYLMMHSDAEIDQILLKFITGRIEDMRKTPSGKRMVG